MTEVGGHEQEKGPSLVRLPPMGRLGFRALCERWRGRSGAGGRSEGPGEAAVGNTRPKVNGTQNAAPLCEPAQSGNGSRRPGRRYEIILTAGASRLNARGPRVGVSADTDRAAIRSFGIANHLRTANGNFASRGARKLGDQHGNIAIKPLIYLLNL